jgi:glycosyltransferase involved in cell wall biosynthesis
VIELTRALLRRGASVEAITLNPNLADPRLLPADLERGERLRYATASTFAEVGERGAFAYHLMSPMELDHPAPLTFSRAGFERAAVVVATLYDLIPLIYSGRYLADPRVREPYLARLELLRRADLLVAISEHSRRDAIERLSIDPVRVVSIGGGASDFFRPATEFEDPLAAVRRDLPAITREIVLTVAGFEWRKNTEALIDAFSRLDPSLRRNLQLVIACSVPPEGERAWRAHAARCGLDGDDLVVTGYVPEPLLRSLYQAASLFVFPSHYEGYGLPALEAACCGAAVITSNSSSLPEVLDLSASVFPPEDVDAMADRMAAGLVDTALRDELLAAGRRARERHTWDAVADRTMAAYRQLDGPVAHRRRRPPRPRVALVGPLPPVQSGVALYNERVLGVLDRSAFDLNLFTETPPGTARPVPTIDVPCYPVEALGGHLDPHDYDTIVYTIGNSRFHVRTFDLARRIPGVLWLHDAFLMGLHLEWALWQIRSGRRSEHPVGILREEIEQQYCGRVDAEPLVVEPLSEEIFIDRQVYLAAGLARASRRLVVNSELACAMVRHDLGPDGDPLPITVLRHAVPSPETLAIPSVRTPRARPLIVALGIVHRVKRPEVVIAAAAALGADVAFVGPCEPDYHQQLQAFADGLGVASRVIFTGFADVATYGCWIGDADIAVQLRDLSFGESSGAIHDAIAGGLPVVTSVASAVELPAELVTMVAPDCSAETLQGVLRALLKNPARARSATAAAAYAAQWSFARVGEELTAVMLADANRHRR